MSPLFHHSNINQIRSSTFQMLVSNYGVLHKVITGVRPNHINHISALWYFFNVLRHVPATSSSALLGSSSPRTHWPLLSRWGSRTCIRGRCGVTKSAASLVKGLFSSETGSTVKGEPPSLSIWDVYNASAGWWWSTRWGNANRYSRFLHQTHWHTACVFSWMFDC